MDQKLWQHKNAEFQVPPGGEGCAGRELGGWWRAPLCAVGPTLGCSLCLQEAVAKGSHGYEGTHLGFKGDRGPHKKRGPRESGKRLVSSW